MEHLLLAIFLGISSWYAQVKAPGFQTMDFRTQTVEPGNFPKCANLSPNDFNVAAALHARGFSDSEVKAAVEWTASELRCGSEPIPASQPIPAKVFVSKLSSLGRVIVVSKPAGASIQVDEQKWPHPTDTSGFAISGTHRFRLELDGMKPLDAYCEVRKDATTRFVATLTNTKSTWVCDPK
jgi:hypothetical protein